MSNSTPPTNLARRRLARGGLAAPVVLATIASKSALAVPYKCTPSGHLSGNFSPVAHGTGSESCNTLGDNCSTWKSRCNPSGGWSSHKTKEFKNCGFPDHYNGKKESESKCWVGSKSKTSSGWKNPALCYHVLAKTHVDGVDSERADWARKAMFAWLNADRYSDYYLTKLECNNMYSAIVSNTGCDIGDMWMPASECKNFLNMIWRA